MTNLVVAFADSAARDAAVVGGKGANLALLSAANLPVPPGFCVTTHAYTEFAAAIGLQERVHRLLAQLDDDAQHVETLTGELRQFITTAAMPQSIATAIQYAYATLQTDAFVAVRSSGTAEDLAGASFAGLHDTYLDIRGADAVVDAVKRCWASMWTARATSYRRNKGFDQTQAKIAVVVQQMVEADVAGVMFTGNPLTSATDEIVINAAYGLGEALVSGIATPDEHVLALDSLRVKEQRVGSKEVRVVRDPAQAFGTVHQDVPESEQNCFALSDKQLRQLGELGKRVMALYQGYPQDIEWAIANGALYLLQARPITGVDFSWDADLEYWQTLPEDDDALWTRSWADELWNGAISPLAYSYRGPMFTEPAQNCAWLCGIKGGIGHRMYKYHKAEVYVNANTWQLFAEKTALPSSRAGLLAHTPPDKAEQILSAPLSVFAFVKMHLTILARGYGPFKFYRYAYDYLDNRIAEADGKSSEELRRLADQDLIRELEHVAYLKTKFSIDLWTGFFIYARDSVTLLSTLLAKWYDGGNAGVFADLFSGLPKRTATSEENLQLWRLSERIRNSKTLRATFESSGVNYLEAFAGFDEGRSFLEDYRKFAAANAFRGHADRDPYYPRRGDDPAIDYENFRTLLAAPASVDPEQREKQVNQRRNAAIADVETCLRRKSFGAARVWAFRRLLGYAHHFFFIRDNQRHYFDRYTYAVRRIALEFGDRLVKRAIFKEPMDAIFLGRQELYQVLEGDLSDALLHRKLAARRHNFDLMLEKKANLPMYLRRSRPVSFAGEGEEAGMKGVGTARGSVTARARVVLDLRNIGQVVQGDILITHSTDPGWTPVFNLISGIVLETGGMLAHGSCLAREYGLPAVQLAGATHSIPDGATITVNGDTGEVIVHEDAIA